MFMRVNVDKEKWEMDFVFAALNSGDEATFTFIVSACEIIVSREHLSERLPHISLKGVDALLFHMPMYSLPILIADILERVGKIRNGGWVKYRAPSYIIYDNEAHVNKACFFFK